MSKNKTVVNTNGGIGFFGLLSVVLIGLKLTGTIAISWLTILGVLFAPLAILLTVFCVMVVVAMIVNK